MRKTIWKIRTRRDSARSGKMLQVSIRDTIWARRLAGLKTPDGFVNLVRVGKIRFPGRGQGECRLPTGDFFILSSWWTAYSFLASRLSW